MPTSALYYPWMHFQDDNWIKLSLLTWDSLVRVRASDVTDRDSALVHQLTVESDFLKEISPSERDLNDVSDAFLEVLATSAEHVVNRYGTDARWPNDLLTHWAAPWSNAQVSDRRDLTWIYCGSQGTKFSDTLARELARHRLARRDGDWLGLQPKLASIYLATLADAIARHNLVSPATDDARMHRAVSALDRHFATAAYKDSQTRSAGRRPVPRRVGTQGAASRHDGRGHGGRRGEPGDRRRRRRPGRDRSPAHAHRRAGVPAQQPGLRAAPPARPVAWLSAPCRRGVRLLVHVAAHRGGADDRHWPDPIRAAGAVRRVLAADRPAEPALALLLRRCRHGRGRTGAARRRARRGPPHRRVVPACAGRERALRPVVRRGRISLHRADPVAAALREFRHHPWEVDFFARAPGNPVAARVTRERIGLSGARSVDTFATTGHLFSASLPLVLETAQRQGLLSSGDLVVLHGGGVGTTYGAIVLRWPDRAA